MSETIYINSIKAKQGKYGIKISGKTEDFIAEIKKHTNEKGYFNLEMFQRKEVGKYGETHGFKVDIYQPKENTNSPF